MKRHYTLALGLGALLSAISFAPQALAQSAGFSEPRAINTGGPRGAYHNDFCPPIPRALANAYFHGYKCTTSAGSVENIERVLAFPTNVSFVQGDALALRVAQKPEISSRLTVIRTDLFCEGLWMVTRNPDLDFGQILGLSRRIKFVTTGVGSGSAASFDFLRSIDPEGLGRVPESNIARVGTALDVIETIAQSTQGEVGFFVQFADPRNPTIKRMVESGVRILPVVSRPILRAKIGETAVYATQPFKLTEGSFVGIMGRERVETTACTQVALITGSPDSHTAADARADSAEMVSKLRELPRTSLFPQDNFLRSILSSAISLSQQAADAAADGVERVRRSVAE